MSSDISSALLKDNTPSNISEEPLAYGTDEIAALRKKLSPELHANISDSDLSTIFHHIENYTVVQAFEILERALIDHKDDPAIPPRTLHRLNQILLKSHNEDKDFDSLLELKFQAFLVHEWSIYPEVRTCTRPIDEPDEIQETWRVFVLGIFWSCAGSALATFFANRFPSISLGSSALQILIVLSGKLLAQLPNWSIPLWNQKRLELNPSPWGFKEQMLTTLTMSVSVGYPYALLAIVAQQNQEFYGLEDLSIGYMLMLTFSSQFMGFGIAGLTRTFLVYPVQCVWYSVLPTITLNRSLTAAEVRTEINGWKLKRAELFGIFAIVSFIWYFVTNFFFQALGYFDWLAWIKPQNVNFQALTGCISGIALNPVPTFDWNVIDQGGMIAPVFATINQFIGLIISTIAIVIMWYTNTCWTSYLPINSNVLFDKTANKFSVTKILNGNGLLDLEKLREYSLPFYSAGNLINYGINFMIYPAMFVYALLNYGTTMLSSMKLFVGNFSNPRKAIMMYDDRFSRTQRKYPEVPELWFLLILVGSLGLAIATVEYYKFTNTPVWTIFFGAGLATIFTIPFGILYSRTNLSLDINVLFEIIIGYAIPGNGNGLMVSKVYATNFMAQTDNYITNQVQAHYTGLKPRALFRLQILSVICNTFVQTGILYWQLQGGIKDLCNIENSQKFTCQDVRTYFNASVIWGVIGPKRIFDHIYPGIKWCFLIGACYPLVFYAIRKLKMNPLRNVNEMVILSGCMCWAPTNWMYLLPNLYIALLFNWHIKGTYPGWWHKYNYILNASLRVGVAYAGLVKFFGTEYTHPVEINWWGNNVMWKTDDALYTAKRKPLPSKGYFGPDISSLDL